jgi:F-type H+-transporting ATPase subunit a
MNGIVGKTEPGHGTPKQVIFEQTTIAGFPVAYIPNPPSACVGESCPTQHAAEGGEHGGAEAHAAADGKFSGLISPYFRSVNTDVNTPLAIAIFSFIFVEFWGLSALGPGYLKKFFAWDFYKKGPLGLIDIFVGILELVSELSRMVSFTFRLFGNVFAGEVLLAMMSFLVPFVLVDVFFGLELFVGLIQAFVFAMLTLVFAQTAVSHHGGEEHGGEHGEAHH